MESYFHETISVLKQPLPALSASLFVFVPFSDLFSGVERADEGAAERCRKGGRARGGARTARHISNRVKK
eukprot:1123590-Pyramimonas_sp.AAC.1